MGHSKLKMLVANIAFQCIKTVEAAALNPQHTICENGPCKNTYDHKFSYINPNDPC